MKMILALLAVLIVAGCTNQKEASRVLLGAGYKNATFTGYGWFACGKDDFYATKFVALGPTGVPVEGCVCSGLIFKNSTIRLN